MTQYGGQQNWKTKFLVGGTLAGALVGLLTAFMLARAAEENGDGPPQIDTMDALKVGIGLFGTVRAVAALADKK
jgi:hypothetical protein